MDAEEARALLGSARVARLASTDLDGQPHLVPITFALSGEEIVTAVDSKPKRTTRLKRLANIAANPRVSVLVDHYEDDWSQLWWVRADGLGRIVEPGTREHDDAMAPLASRYKQYGEIPPDGPAIVISVSRWSGWRARP